MLSNHLILCCPFLLCLQSFPAPGSFPMSQFFASGSIGETPKYWSFCFSISPSNEYSGLISFRMDWLDLLAVQGTLKSLLQYHSSKTSILPRSGFFMIQLSHHMDFPGASDGKVSVYNAGDLGSIPGSGRSAGEGNGNPLQYYCLENPMDRGAW